MIGSGCAQNQLEGIVEQPKGFEVFEINPQIVAKGKKTTELVRTDLIRANVQVVTDGGETNLHAHTGMDAMAPPLLLEASKNNKRRKHDVYLPERRSAS